MGYEAPWSQKVGTKKSPSHVLNNDEMEGFWTAYARYVNNRKGKKNTDEEVVGIVYRNMLDNWSVSHSPLPVMTKSNSYLLSPRGRWELAAKK